MVSDMRYKISILERESETDEEYGDGMEETAGMVADTRVWHELTLTRKRFELQHPPLISRGSLILDGFCKHMDPKDIIFPHY